MRGARRFRATPVPMTARARTIASMMRKFIEPPRAWPVAGRVVVVVPPPVPVATAPDPPVVPPPVPVATAEPVVARVALGAVVAAVVAVAARVALGAVVAAVVALGLGALVPEPAVLVPVVCAKPEPAVNAKTVRNPTTSTRSMESRLPTHVPTFLRRWLCRRSVTTLHFMRHPHIIHGGWSVIQCRTLSAKCGGK